MKLTSILGFAVATMMVACTAKPEANDNPVLTIEGGQIQGVLTDSTNVMVYKGIPYAAPPVGDLRWKRPQPVVPWEGVKVMDTFSAASVQAAHTPGEFYTEEFYFGGDPEFSEDCLYLNVWAPAESVGKTDAKLPVAFWVHGGAYSAGWGHEITMDGDAWATRGVILVTINYRLGVLGFLSHPLLSKEDVDGVSGNYGTWDQVAALKWVKKNIAQFGGDPDNIMIFGQSAGAASIKNLVTSNESKKLVSKAIIQSIGGLGELIPGPAQDVAETQGKDIMDMGGFTTLEAMRSATPQQLSEALSKYMAEKRAWLMMVPHIDGRLLGKTFTEAAQDNTIADVPYMLGSTLDDMMPTMGEGIDQFAFLRETQSKQPVYAYRFDRRLPGEPNTAYHSSELWFVFKTLKNSRRPFTAADYELSDRMMDYWTNFAKYGNPNGAADGEWKADTQEHPFTMHLDIRSLANPLKKDKFIQINIVVGDIYKAAKAWAALLDIPVPEVRTNHLEYKPEFPYTYRGEPSTCDLLVCDIDMGSWVLELHQADEKASSFREFYDKHGNGVHHLGFEVGDLRDEVIKELQGLGFDTDRTFGAYTGSSWTIVDSEDVLGVNLNIKPVR